MGWGIPWSILFARAAIAPAQGRIETGSAAAWPVFCYHGAVFWGEAIREARMSVAQARGIVKGLKWHHLGFCFFWAVTFVALLAPSDEFAFASTGFSVGKQISTISAVVVAATLSVRRGSKAFFSRVGIYRRHRPVGWVPFVLPRILSGRFLGCLGHNCIGAGGSFAGRVFL